MIEPSSSDLIHAGKPGHQGPEITIVITCFNQGRFLDKAIQSVLQLNHPSLECVLIDDGSTDDTASVAGKYPGVRYHYQTNKGLSAARNKGTELAKGEYILYLDADDWLFPQGLPQALALLKANPGAAFVSGTYLKAKASGAINQGYQVPGGDFYQRLLEGNFIGMHAAVLYRSDLTRDTPYDETLKAGEDYDRYLRISARLPVVKGSHLMAAYRIHESNMTGNLDLMESEILRIHARHRPSRANHALYASWKKGRKDWIYYFCHLRMRESGHKKKTSEKISMILRHPFTSLKLAAESPGFLPSRITRKLMGWLGYRPKGRFPHWPYEQAQGNVLDAGRLMSLDPFDRDFGFNRGGPADRVYIADFLGKHAGYIRGRVLEIGDSLYTREYGQGPDLVGEVLHVSATGPGIHYTADLAHAPDIPDEHFDAILLIQTLHLIWDFSAALRTCQRILKPGGVLLLTVPGITPIDRGEWKESWYWSFTEASLRRMATENLPSCTKTIFSYGNVYTASSFLYGLGRQELYAEAYHAHDPQFPVILGMFAQKAVD